MSAGVVIAVLAFTGVSLTVTAVRLLRAPDRGSRLSRVGVLGDLVFGVALLALCRGLALTTFSQWVWLLVMLTLAAGSGLAVARWPHLPWRRGHHGGSVGSSPSY